MEFGIGQAQLKDELNRMAPAAARAHLGDTLYDLITNFNAFLAHLDSGAVTGIGTANVADYAVKLPENR